MNELFEIYKRIEYLRNNGVKMKEIADHTQMAASVLFRSTPAYCRPYRRSKERHCQEEALDYALASEQRIQETAARESGRHERKAFELEPPQGGEKRKKPFLGHDGQGIAGFRTRGL